MMSDLEKNFKNVIRGMDIPSFRREDYSWLFRNMGLRNSEHENFEEAKELLIKICKEKNLIKKSQLNAV